MTIFAVGLDVESTLNISNLSFSESGIQNELVQEEKQYNFDYHQDVKNIENYPNYDQTTQQFNNQTNVQHTSDSQKWCIRNNDYNNKNVESDLIKPPDSSEINAEASDWANDIDAGNDMNYHVIELLESNDILENFKNASADDELFTKLQETENYNLDQGKLKDNKSNENTKRTCDQFDNKLNKIIQDWTNENSNNNTTINRERDSSDQKRIEFENINSVDNNKQKSLKHTDINYRPECERQVVNNSNISLLQNNYNQNYVQQQNKRIEMKENAYRCIESNDLNSNLLLNKKLSDLPQQHTQNLQNSFLVDVHNSNYIKFEKNNNIQEIRKEPRDPMNNLNENALNSMNSIAKISDLTMPNINHTKNISFVLDNRKQNVPKFVKFKIAQYETVKSLSSDEKLSDKTKQHLNCTQFFSSQQQNSYIDFDQTQKIKLNDNMTTTSINPNYIESIRAPANFIQAKQNYSSEPNFSFLKNHNDKNDIEFQNTNMEDSHNLNEIAQWKMNSNSINNNEKLLESSRQNTSLHGKHEQHYFGSGNMQGIGCNQIYKHCVNNNGEKNDQKKSHSSTNFVDKNIFTQYVSDQNFSTIHPIQCGGNVSSVEPQNDGIRNQMQNDDIHNNKSINKQATLQIGINFDRPKEYSNKSLQFAQDNAYQIFDNPATIKNNINTNKMWCDQSRNQNRCQNFNRNTDIKNDDSYEINRSYTQIGGIENEALFNNNNNELYKNYCNTELQKYDPGNDYQNFEDNYNLQHIHDYSLEIGFRARLQNSNPEKILPRILSDELKNDVHYLNSNYPTSQSEGNVDDNYKNVNEMDCNFHQTRDDYVSKCLDSNIVSHINTPTVTQNDVEMSTTNDNMYSTNLEYASNEHQMPTNQHKYRELFSKLNESYNAIVKTPVLSPYDVKISPITKSDMGFKYSDYTNRNNNTRFGYCKIQDERNDIRHRQFLKRQPILYESPNKKKISNFDVRGWPMVNPASLVSTFKNNKFLCI